MSETRRSTANLWFNNTLLSRLDDKRTGAIVIVMQRVHLDDLTGFLLDQCDEWEVLSLPAIAEYAEEIRLPNDRVHYRRPGDVLSPEREPMKVLEAIRQQIGSGAFSAQYQQSPVPPGGAMIKRHWVKRYNERPSADQCALKYQSWDTASKGGPENDWSVCTTWIRTYDTRWYMVDVWRQRVDYPSLKAAVAEQARRWKVRRVLVEDAASGIALVQELQRVVAGIIAVKPDRDKVSRMSVASAMFEAGQVDLPERAAWLAELEAELFAFPGSRHDDQCDSISQALSDEVPTMSLLSREQCRNLLRRIAMAGARAQRW